MGFKKSMLTQLQHDLKKHASEEKARIYARFFKTGKGEYGEGDKFLGLTVPEQRALARKYTALPLTEIKQLLDSKYHEHRLTGFIILVYKYEKAKENEKQNIIDFYIKNRHRANNWDLIDYVADKLLGKYLMDKDKSLLYELAKSPSLWDRRIAIITTFEFIKSKKFDDTLRIAEMMLHDKHDLIHKAVGWMLREVGKRDQAVEEEFLKKHSKQMPRTMLRYAIERFDKAKRESYLKK